VAAVHEPGKIGPNSIIQTVAALEEAYGVREARAILMRGGAGDLPDHLPSALIDEGDFHALVEVLIGQIGAAAVTDILSRSGQRTSEYVFANRIPPMARFVLRVLPPPLSLRVLLPAMKRHTWTFAGSGAFTCATGKAPWLAVSNPALFDTPAMAAAMCAYYRGAFEHMLRMLVSPRVMLRDVECQACGDRRCRYAIAW